MTVYGMAQKYYPRLWSIERIEALYKAGKLSEEEYTNLVDKNQANKEDE